MATAPFSPVVSQSLSSSTSTTKEFTMAKAPFSSTLFDLINGTLFIVSGIEYAAGKDYKVLRIEDQQIEEIIDEEQSIYDQLCDLCHTCYDGPHNAVVDGTSCCIDVGKIREIVTRWKLGAL